MAPLCTGPPTPGSNDCGSKKDFKPILIGAVDALRQFVERGRTMAENIVPSTSCSEQNRLQTAESYMQLRMAGNKQKLLGLVSDDIELQSSRDGSFVGKQQFSSYLDSVKPTGTWKNATWNKDGNRAEILGNVRIFMVNIGVIAHMKFNNSGRINRIYVGTKSKSSK